MAGTFETIAQDAIDAIDSYKTARASLFQWNTPKPATLSAWVSTWVDMSLESEKAASALDKLVSVTPNRWDAEWEGAYNIFQALEHTAGICINPLGSRLDLPGELRRKANKVRHRLLGY